MVMGQVQKKEDNIKDRYVNSITLEQILTRGIQTYYIGDTLMNGFQLDYYYLDNENRNQCTCMHFFFKDTVNLSNSKIEDFFASNIISYNSVFTYSDLSALYFLEPDTAYYSGNLRLYYSNTIGKSWKDEYNEFRFYKLSKFEFFRISKVQAQFYMIGSESHNFQPYNVHQYDTNEVVQYNYRYLLSKEFIWPDKVFRIEEVVHEPEIIPCHYVSD
jgi:hypothetical protein